MNVLTPMIRNYYAKRKLKEPTAWEALAWAQTELGEVYEHLLTQSGKWVRNHPENHPTEFVPAKFGEELGDAIMMLVKAGLAEGVDPLDCLYNKINIKEVK